jgi:hypothetical protein
VTVAKSPNDIEQRWGSGVSNHVDEVEAREFVTLKPGESTRFKVSLRSSFVEGPPGTQKLTITYWNSGRKQHLKAWVGSLEVAIGPAWKGPFKLERIVEKWPNGNLKARGYKLGDRKVGPWTYWNEQGDRIRRDDYDEGTTFEYDPSHPDNKGQGKPKAKQ